jgi:hypothetical protein
MQIFVIQFAVLIISKHNFVSYARLITNLISLLCLLYLQFFCRNHLDRRISLHAHYDYILLVCRLNSAS